MKIIQICNLHRVRGGREAMAELTAEVLKRRGHEVQILTRDSRETLSSGVLQKALAFNRGFYSPRDRKIISKIIHDWKPNLVHIHGLFPLFSPWILVEFRRARVPVILACHDYSLTCPTDHHLRKGKICEKCLGGREYRCALLNCRQKLLESCAYALRSAFVRKAKFYQENVACFIPPSRDVESRLVEAGFPKERMFVVPNMVELKAVPIDNDKGKYVAFAGRISPEKGVDTLLIAAQLTGFPVRLAGDYLRMPDIIKSMPDNVQLLGNLNQMQLSDFYSNARFLIVPSIWYETFGLVVLEGMMHGLPIIASKIGGIPEIVDDGVTGFLFNPGNAEELAAKMRILWHNPELCQRMGRAGYEKVIREYGESAYYERLMMAYEKGITMFERDEHRFEG